MKFLKKLSIMLTAVMICLIPLLESALTVHAEGPVTYYIKYVDGHGDFQFQKGEWKEDDSERELYYMYQDIKDGDLLVIDSTAASNLKVDVQLSNLTIVHAPSAVITAKGIDNCYVINDSIAAINGNVTYAAVYDKSIVTFNDNVGTLELLSEKYENLHHNVSVAGTVDHVKASDKNEVHFEFYNFSKNSFCVEDGELTTAKTNYSETATAAAQTPAPTPTATPAPETPAPSVSSGEYDDVPKTGDIRFNPFWLIAIAAMCMIGSYEVKRR